MAVLYRGLEPPSLACSTSFLLHNHEKLNTGTDMIESDAVVLRINTSIRKTRFTLKGLDHKDFCIKECEDGTIEFKNVPGLLFPQAFKYYHNLECTERDFLFLHER